MEGEIIFISAYSLRDDSHINALVQSFKRANEAHEFQFTKAFPEEINIVDLPRVLNLKEEQIKIKDKTFNAKVQLALYSIGDVSIRIRINFKNEEELDLLNLNEDYIRGTLQLKIRNLINSKLYDLNDELSKEEEDYKIFYLNTKSSKIDKKWLTGLLLSEPEYSKLSENYVNESLKRSLSYFTDQIVYIDWDGMIIIGENLGYEEEIIVSEIANIQFLELRLYNNITNEFLSNIVSELKKINSPFGYLLKRRKLEDLDVKVSTFYDDLQDTLNKINNAFASFGDWYLAKLYSFFAESFKLREWRENISSNLDVLQRISDAIRNNISSSVNETLEWLVIILIIIEIVVEFVAFIK